MDSVAEIKSRLPIEDLVRQYCQLHKKGRNFVALCPFHHDSSPSLLVSPDKGIAYCFPCQKGGDVFSFYQLIEGVDFRQAIKDLADRTGVTLPEAPGKAVSKDERVRARECLESAATFYRHSLQSSATTKEYLLKRGVTDAEIETFGVGLAPDSFTATYEHLLKDGFSRSEIIAAGLGAVRDIQDQRVYDRFRNRVMFPIADQLGRLAGFGGRTLGKDDAKYVNSPDGILYHKSNMLFGMHLAKEAMREKKDVILVEGYFDALACHRAGALNTVATCGTALTEEHVRLLKRYVDTVTLCLDQDRAGREAAERACTLLSKEGIHVQAIVLPQKDAADVAQENLAALTHLLQSSAKPYIETVLEEIKTLDLKHPRTRRQSLERVIALISPLQAAVERAHYLREAAAALGTTESALLEDVLHLGKHAQVSSPRPRTQSVPPSAHIFTSSEITLGLFLLYPACLDLLSSLIPPEEGMGEHLYSFLKDKPADTSTTIDQLPLSDEDKSRLRILLLYCEDQGLSHWNESVARREIQRNCMNSNRETLRRKQQEVSKRLLEARKRGDAPEEQQLQNQYQQLLKLAKMAF